MTLQNLLEEQEKEFEKRFLGKCSDYHDPKTHQNYPSVWKEKMLNVEELKSFLYSSQTKLIKGVIEEIKLIQTEFFERESDEYDRGCKNTLQKVIDYLGEIYDKKT